MMNHWEKGVDRPPQGEVKKISDSCIEFGVWTRFRVGDFGNRGLAVFHAGSTLLSYGTPMFGEVPWFFHVLGSGRFCCDGSYDVMLVYSAFPNAALYIDNERVDMYDPFKGKKDPWNAVMMRWLVYPVGRDVYDQIGGVMHFRGNVLTNHGPVKVE